MFRPAARARMAANEALIQQMADEKVAETAVLGVEGMMGRLFGEDMGVIAAALETLAIEEDDGEDEEGGRELSYLFGGLMWKLLCGDADAESYLGFLADAATDLLTGKMEEGEDPWRHCLWPAVREIGFVG